VNNLEQSSNCRAPTTRARSGMREAVAINVVAFRAANDASSPY